MEGVRLKQVDISHDIRFLYDIMNAEDQYLYSTKLKFYAIEQFEKWFINRMYDDFHDFFIVYETGTSKAIGYVHNYDFSLVDGHCKLVVYILSEYRKTGLGGIAAVTFMKQLFLRYPLRKLYSTVYEYNSESLQSNLAAGFEVEGMLKDYRYFNGRYYGLYYLSISKDKFEKTIGKLVR